MSDRDVDDQTTVNQQIATDAMAAVLPQAQAALVVYHKDGVKVVPLMENQGTVVGRSWPADAVVPDPSLSRQHARFTWSRGGVDVEDLGSTNGTRVRGDRIQKARVLPGETVVLGSITASVNVAAGGAQLRGIDGEERFLTRLADELTRSRSFDRALAVVMVRAVSVEQGHVSAWVPRVRGQLRDVDHVMLYGSSSIAILLPETDADTAVETAQSLVRSGLVGEPRLVAGVATFPEAQTSDELIDAARQAARRATLDSPVVRLSGDDEATVRDRAVVVVSERMREVYDLVRRVATGTIPILVHGETGSGKEVVARAIHAASPRRRGPLKSINCGAIPPTLIESALFGHEKGAFTGAERSAPGLFEQADGGTLFLDEIGELSPAAQAALLRVLETHRVTRVGGTEEIAVDVRVVAATHRDLEAMATTGEFRTDLYYRLNAMTLSVPPLRDRPEDVDPLADLFLKEASRASGRAIATIADEARALLRTYSWPGNVRELRNAIERAVLICRGEQITVEDLSDRIRRGTDLEPPTAPGGGAVAGAAVPSDADFKERVRLYETQLILDALRRAEGNQTQAAKLLRMPLRTLVHKIKSYGIKKMYETDD